MKMTKRAICLLLAAVMALALTVPVLAMDEPDTPSVTEAGKTVKLDPGSGGAFSGQSKGEVYEVTLTEEGKLPQILPEPTREGWDFQGWYTELPTEGELQSVTDIEDGQSYTYKKEVFKPNGDEIKAGGVVPADVNKLYAYYMYQTVELKLNANGWNNIFHALSCTRLYDKVITEEDLVVINMTHESWDKIVDWNGTVFDGWWTEPNGGTQFKPDGHTTFGQLVDRGVKELYAHWHNDAMNVTQNDATQSYDVTKPTGNLMFGDNIHMQNWIHCGDPLTLTVRRGFGGSLAGIKWTIEDPTVIEITSQAEDGSSITVKGLGNNNDEPHSTKVTATLGGQSVSVYVNVGHHFIERTTVYAARCEDRGQEDRYCAECGRQIRVYVPELGHNYAITSTVPGSCTASEKTVQECTRCHKTVETVTAAPKGHQFKDTVEDGCGGKIEIRTCTVCGYTETTGGDGSAHTWETSPTIDIPATCIHEGSQSTHCSNCHATKDVTSIPATGVHSYGDWTVTKQPHYHSTGERVRTCTVCGAKQTEILPEDDNVPGTYPSYGGGGGGGGGAAPEETPTPTPSETPSPSPEPSPEPGTTPEPSPVPVPVDPPKTEDGSGWSYDYDTGDYYYFVEGEPKANYWAMEEAASQWGYWYYVGSDGKLATGLQYIENSNGTGWYFLQPDTTNGCIGRMLTGWQWIGTEAGTGWFNTAHGGVNGQCTYTTEWGDYNASDNTWGKDHIAH